VVPNYVVVAFLCEELGSKPSHVTNSVCSTTFTGGSTQSPKNRGLLADAIKEFGTCVFRDIIGDFELSPRTRGFGVNNTVPYQLDVNQIFQQILSPPFRNPFTIKVRKCLDEEGVTECGDATTANCRQRDADRRIRNGMTWEVVRE
jgi:hypothetical protein